MFLTNLQKDILKNKGFDIENEDLKTKEMEKFLNPSWDRDLFNILKMKDIEKSVERIKKAIDNNEKIIIYADYDCDGIPGAVILNDFFQKINYKDFSVYIPHRHNEGYGINQNAIQKFIDEKVSLIITIDLGITNIQEIKLAKEKGIDVIVTDHHLPIIDEKGEQILPEAFSIINSKQDKCEYEEKFLCGSSTIWKLIHAFLNKYRKDFNVGDGWEKWLLDMVGIATIADLVPLKNENRLFAKYGLEVLRKSKRPGLQKILKNAKVDQRKITEDDIGFAIAPRINSASRMADPIYAFYALLQNEDSLNYANELEKYNLERKQNTKDANESVNYEILKDKKIILIGNEKWTPGIVGLVASKVSQKTGKTTFVWGMGEDKNILKGSVRKGDDDYNVVHTMTDAKNILENFGGHEEAGGFALQKNNLEAFEKFLEMYSSKNVLKENLKDKRQKENFINIDLEKINKSLFREINIFAPFGIGNEKIIFKIKIKDNDFLKTKRFGKNNEHLEININGIRGIEFFVDKEREEELSLKKELLVNIEWDNFKSDVVMKFL
ncbi:MAG: single-stranded-DNA-specific exonuclease RecJ [Candidatus Pacebacteria bacterium]|nr:single-stranded-DNA-specific exonuclease RecJ [Candidatus Paceibacterota bacterium]